MPPVKTKAAVGNLQTDSTIAWTDITGLAITLTTQTQSAITALLVCECKVVPGYQMMFGRILVDGVPCSPGDVALTWVDGPMQTRSLLAVSKTLPAGKHKVTAQWMVTNDAGGTTDGYLGKRALTAFAS